MNKPLVTVALPIYNSAAYLQSTLDDISNQSFENFEVIAVLDGCTDESETILTRHADSRITIVRKQVNEGLVRALNDIHSRASGKYVARFDQDDRYHPDRIGKQVAFLESHQNVDVLGSRFDYIDEQGKPLSPAKPFPLSHKRIQRDFQRYTAIGGPTCMYRLKRIHALGNYDEQFCFLEDVSLWLKCLAAGCTFANLPDVLVHYRVHSNQTSRAWGEKQIPQLREAYARYGPKIWGKVHREYGAREPKLERWKRKITDALIPER